MKWFMILISLVLFLAACGQGDDNQTTPIDNTGGTEVDNDEEVANDPLDEDDVTEEEANNDMDEKDEESEETTESEGNHESAAKIDNVQLFFADDQIMDTYRVETGESVTKDEAGAKQAYELWLAGPTNEDLASLVPENTQIQSVEFINDVAHVSFSEHILNANLGSGGEAMLIDQIALIVQQFGYGKTQILIDGDIPNSFLGHMDVSEPYEAGNPNDYEVKN